MLDLINPQFEAIAREMFATMLDWEVEARPPEAAPERPGVLDLLAVTGSIGFAGKMVGTLFFSTEESLAKGMASRLLGSEAAGDPGQVSDVMGELTNMLAGGCKSRLCDLGYPVVITIPTIIRGKGVRAAGKDAHFVATRGFSVPSQAESFKVILVGRLN
jgi:chemotaxis protein CheX